MKRTYKWQNYSLHFKQLTHHELQISKKLAKKTEWHHHTSWIEKINEQKTE